jgi:hypothetical protein
VVSVSIAHLLDLSMSQHLYANIPGVTHPRSIQIEEAHSNVTTTATIEADSTTLDLSSSVTIDMGYSDAHEVLFSGYVKRIEHLRPDGTVRITAYDTLVRAVDLFIASDDPEKPFTEHSVSSKTFVNDLLGLAGLPGVVTGEPSPVFTWGTNEDGAKINLQSVSDALSFICQITGNIIYATVLGNIHFEYRPPYIVGGDTSSYTFSNANSNISSILLEETNDPTRNVVKVYGKTPLTAKAVAGLGALVVDQTAVIAHELLDTDSICQATANVNLTLLNRISKTFTVTAIGDTSIRARNIATVSDAFVHPAAKEVYIFRANHMWSSSGYSVECVCTFSTPNS